MKITKRLKDLPKPYFIPNKCEVCGKDKSADLPHTFWWIIDGDDAHGVCCKHCAEVFVKNREAVKK
jgi:hypothetical protein